MRLNDKHLLRCVQKTGTQQVSFDIPSEPTFGVRSVCVGPIRVHAPRLRARPPQAQSCQWNLCERSSSGCRTVLACLHSCREPRGLQLLLSHRVSYIRHLSCPSPALRTYFRPAARPPFPNTKHHENAIYQRSDAKRLSSPIFRSTLRSMVAFPDRDSRLNAKILWRRSLD